MHVLASDVVSDTAELYRRFKDREPFRHLVLDGFFRADYAQQLAAQFPAFESGNARNESGQLGGKSVVERIRELGRAYATLDDLVQSTAFLRWLSSATGIPDLLYDPHYFGGGTHDNRAGQELDPHVDFNRHPVDGWHRRLNLIVYLNHEWHDDWGGSLELHSDPRSDDDRVKLVTPLFNRCVIFETTEWSWHGFSRIDLPADRSHLSRRSIALYFYTRERPAEELASTHSTIYVDRPLPERFAAGYTLGEADVQELRVLLKRRDMHNQRLYEDTIRLQAQLDGARALGLVGTKPHGALYWLARGLLAIARSSARRRRLPDRATVKQAMIPFVTALPPSMSHRLRSIWRYWNPESPAVAGTERTGPIDEP